MDKVIDRLYQMELNADQSLDTLNDKRNALKDKYDALRTAYQQEAEKEFDEQKQLIREAYEKEKNEQLKAIEAEFKVDLERVHKVFEHEQEHYVDMFMSTVKELGVIDDE